MYTFSLSQSPYQVKLCLSEIFKDEIRPIIKTMTNFVNFLLLKSLKIVYLTIIESVINYDNYGFVGAITFNC